MASTYTPIATTTLSGTSSGVTFSSISGSYTDIVLIGNFWASSSNVVTPSLRFNSDTSSNYSSTSLYGFGTSTYSVRHATTTLMYLGDFAAGITTNAPDPYILQINNYSNSTTYKTVLCRYNQINASNGEVGATVGLWRSTSAVTSITITSNGGQNYAIGSTFTLYGITAA